MNIVTSFSLNIVTKILNILPRSILMNISIAQVDKAFEGKFRKFREKIVPYINHHIGQIIFTFSINNITSMSNHSVKHRQIPTSQFLLYNGYTIRLTLQNSQHILQYRFQVRIRCGSNQLKTVLKDFFSNII